MVCRLKSQGLAYGLDLGFRDIQDCDFGVALSRSSVRGGVLKLVVLVDLCPHKVPLSTRARGTSDASPGGQMRRTPGMSSTAQQRSSAKHSTALVPAEQGRGTGPCPATAPARTCAAWTCITTLVGVPTATGSARRVPHSPAALGKIEPSPPCPAPHRLHRPLHTTPHLQRQRHVHAALGKLRSTFPHLWGIILVDWKTQTSSLQLGVRWFSFEVF